MKIAPAARRADFSIWVSLLNACPPPARPSRSGRRRRRPAILCRSRTTKVGQRWSRNPGRAGSGCRRIALPRRDKPPARRSSPAAALPRHRPTPPTAGAFLLPSKSRSGVGPRPAESAPRPAAGSEPCSCKSEETSPLQVWRAGWPPAGRRGSDTLESDRACREPSLPGRGGATQGKNRVSDNRAGTRHRRQDEPGRDAHSGVRRSSSMNRRPWRWLMTFFAAWLTSSAGAVRLWRFQMPPASNTEPTRRCTTDTRDILYLRMRASLKTGRLLE